MRYKIQSHGSRVPTSATKVVVIASSDAGLIGASSRTRTASRLADRAVFCQGKIIVQYLLK